MRKLTAKVASALNLNPLDASPTTLCHGIVPVSGFHLQNREFSPLPPLKLQSNGRLVRGPRTDSRRGTAAASSTACDSRSAITSTDHPGGAGAANVARRRPTGERGSRQLLLRLACARTRSSPGTGQPSACTRGSGAAAAGAAGAAAATGAAVAAAAWRAEVERHHASSTASSASPGPATGPRCGEERKESLRQAQ